MINFPYLRKLEEQDDELDFNVESFYAEVHEGDVSAVVKFDRLIPYPKSQDEEDLLGMAMLEKFRDLPYPKVDISYYKFKDPETGWVQVRPDEPPDNEVMIDAANAIAGKSRLGTDEVEVSFKLEA